MITLTPEELARLNPHTPGLVAMLRAALPPKIFRVETEVEFDAKRKWRLDIGVVRRGAERVVAGIEIHGGTWDKRRKNRHTEPKGYRDDREKMNAAALQYILVLEFTDDMAADWGYVSEAIKILVERIR